MIDELTVASLIRQFDTWCRLHWGEHHTGSSGPEKLPSCGSVCPGHTAVGFLRFSPVFRPCVSPSRRLAGRWNANRRTLNRITDSDSVALARCRWHYRGIAPESGKSNQAVTLPEGWRSSDCRRIHSNFLWSGRVSLRRQTEEMEPCGGRRHGADKTASQ